MLEINYVISLVGGNIGNLEKKKFPQVLLSASDLLFLP
jgi:hypothetical protein